MPTLCRVFVQDQQGLPLSDVIGDLAIAGFDFGKLRAITAIFIGPGDQQGGLLFPLSREADHPEIPGR